MKFFRFSLFLFLGVFCASQFVWAKELNYTVAIKGIKDQSLRTHLEGKSLLFRLIERKPGTEAGLTRRIKSDIATFSETMREYGYYGADVSYDTHEKDGSTHIEIHILKGDLYTIDGIELNWPNHYSPAISALEEIKEPAGKVALPDEILNVEHTVLSLLMQNGFPVPSIMTKKLLVNHNTKSVTAKLWINPGPMAEFGTTEITGLTRLEAPFVERRIRWVEGEGFNVEKVASTRKALLRSGVISSSNILYGNIGEDGTVPLTLDIKERKHRSIGAGASYSTTRDLIASVFWEHRNLLGQAEKFRVKLEGGTETYGMVVDLNKPDMFGYESVSWQNSIEIRQESLEAFDKETSAYRTLLNYNYSSTSAVSGGVTLERSRIEEDGEPEDIFTLLSFPITYRYDGTDNFLNPRTGMRFNLGFTPYQILNDTQSSFAKTDARVSHYLPVTDRFVWANHARAAIVYGQALETIPADKRLYSGGGGSVRGYGHQLLGPLDAENDPTGGRLAFEIGTEGRFKITDKIETVGFVEGGQVSEDLDFSSNSDFLWSVGTGVRYHTPIGPMRVDIAVPLDKREPDDGFQFYISLGQAF